MPLDLNNHSIQLDSLVWYLGVLPGDEGVGKDVRPTFNFTNIKQLLVDFTFEGEQNSGFFILFYLLKNVEQFLELHHSERKTETSSSKSEKPPILDPSTHSRASHVRYLVETLVG